MPLSDILDHPVIFADEMSLIVRSFRALCDSDAALAVSRFSNDNGRQGGCRAKIALVTPWFKDVYSAEVWEMVSSFARRVPDSECVSSALRTWLERRREIKEEDYRAALNLWMDLMAEVWETLGDYDFVATLATTDTAPLRSEGTGSRAPQRLWNLIGCPAISGPIGAIGGLPVGLQIISRPWSDATLLDFAGNTFRDPIRGRHNGRSP